MSCLLLIGKKGEPYSMEPLTRALYKVSIVRGWAPHHTPLRDLRMLVNLAHFMATLATCLWPFNLESRITPRNLCEEVDVIVSPSSTMELPTEAVFFLENITRADLEEKTFRSLDLRCAESLLAEVSIFLRFHKITWSGKSSDVICELKDLAFAGDMFSATSGVDIKKQKTENKALRKAFPRDADIGCFSVDAKLDVSARGEIINEPTQFRGDP